MAKSNQIMIPGKVFSMLEDTVNQYDLSDYDICIKLFDDAVNLIELFKNNVESKISELPQREDIGISCYWLLTLSNETQNDKYWKTTIKLLDLSQGVSLYHILAEVVELRTHAVHLVEQALLKQDKINKHHETHEDIF